MLNAPPAPAPSSSTVKAASSNSNMLGQQQYTASAAPTAGLPAGQANVLNNAVNNSPAGAGLNQAIGLINKQLQLSGSLGADNGAQAAAQAELPDQLARLNLQLQGLGVQSSAQQRALGQLAATQHQTALGYNSAQNALIQSLGLDVHATAFQNAIQHMLGILNTQQYQGMDVAQWQATQQQMQQERSSAIGSGAAGSGGLPWWQQSQLAQYQGYHQRYASEEAQAQQQARLSIYNNNIGLQKEKINTANQMEQNRMGYSKSQIDYLKSVQDTQDQLKQLGFQTQDVNLQKQLAQIGAAHAGAGSDAALQQFMAQTGLVSQLANLTAQQGGLYQSVFSSPSFQTYLQNQALGSIFSGGQFGSGVTQPSPLTIGSGGSGGLF